MPITDSGYVAATQAQTEERIKKLLQKNMGEDVVLNVNGSPMTSIFQAEVQESLYADSMLGEAYKQTQVSTATGENLDNIANMNGLSRAQSTYATVSVTFSGKIGLVIPSGFLVATSGNIIFQTLSSSTIPSTGTQDIACQCLTTGVSGNVDIGTITVIVSPLEGLSSVTNKTSATGGGAAENDEDLRKRIQNNAHDNIGTGSFLVNQLLAVNGVSTVNYKENNQYKELDGIPPLSVYFVIDGGSNADIAQVFYKYSAIPFYTTGNEVATITNSFGRTITYYFDRPLISNLTIRIIYKMVNSGSITQEFKSLVENQIKTYINSLGMGIALSGSQILAGAIKDEFITNNQSSFNNIENITIQLKRSSEPNFVDSILFVFREKGIVSGFIYE